GLQRLLDVLDRGGIARLTGRADAVVLVGELLEHLLPGKDGAIRDGTIDAAAVRVGRAGNRFGQPDSRDGRHYGYAQLDCFPHVSPMIPCGWRASPRLWLR